MTPLQAGFDLILVEVFLFVITGCVSYIAWRARQIWHRIDGLVDDVDEHDLIIFGKDGSGFEGVQEKSIRNEERISENREQVKLLSRVVSRIKRALVREGVISEQHYAEVQPWTPDDFTRGGDADPRPDGRDD